ncbi:hypothetical protein [Kitasatospora sp. NPDC091207]|uniref:hypothetical protein n=1 Tax=Kitasatospora sp. NPDC091207 TaxID=3364083 RepID=UPI0037FD450E
MADKPDGEGSGGTTEITDDYLARFAKEKLETLITEINGNPAVTKIRSYDHIPILAGTDGIVFTSPGAFKTSYTEYCKAISLQFGKLTKQLTTLKGDLGMADLILSNAHEEALTEAQLMWLINPTLSGGGGGGGGAGGGGA